MKKGAEILLLCAAIALLMGADSNEARFQRLGDKIMCTCSCAQMLLKCNHVGCPNSARMIGELRALTGATISGPGAGDKVSLEIQSDDQGVLNWFRKTWGVTAVVEPATHGLELWAWIVPILGLGLGFLLAVVIIHNWRARQAQQPVVVAAIDPHLEALRARARRETEI
ncbi:MAG TPA: hypothetical protein VKW06_11810 [Candidatus Angelobacter sp.]|nr:hypothetical protein [Candidatus Angelobacter sp.]